MMIGRSFRVMNSKEVKNLMQILGDQFGIKSRLSYVFLMNNREKIYVITREIETLDLAHLNVDSAGLYIGKMQSDGFRPSIEGSQILGPLATKNVIDINQRQKHEWMQGLDVEVDDGGNAIVFLKSGDDFIGSGKLKGGKVLNSVPKGRRLLHINEGISEEVEENEINL